MLIGSFPLVSAAAFGISDLRLLVNTEFELVCIDRNDTSFVLRSID